MKSIIAIRTTVNRISTTILLLFFSTLAFAFLVLFKKMAFADTSIMDTPLPPDQFFVQVLEAVKNFGGIPWTLQVASILTLLISSMKVTFIREYTWDKLGNFKTFLAPTLAFLAGMFGLAVTGHFSWPAVVAYALAGAGAIPLHEAIDALKNLILSSGTKQ